LAWCPRGVLHPLSCRQSFLCADHIVCGSLLLGSPTESHNLGRNTRQFCPRVACPPGHLHTQAGCPTPFVCPAAPGGIFWSPLRSGQPSSWLQRRKFSTNADTDKHHYAEHAFRQASTFCAVWTCGQEQGLPFRPDRRPVGADRAAGAHPARRVAVRRCIRSAGSWVGTVKCLLGAQIDA
jgi:hypothetical protein